MNIFDRFKKLKEDDNKYIWHPFTQMKEWGEEDPIIITEANECFIRDIKGCYIL